MAPTLFNAVQDYGNESVNDDDEVLYRSPQTVVVRRRASDGDSEVVKSVSGAGASARQKREHACLALLQDVDGVVQLRERPHEQGALLLEDSRGVELNEWLARSSRTIESKIQIALRLTRIVADMHRSGVLHRDINPSNLLVSDSGNRIDLIDFDLACLLSEAASKGGTSRELVGTLAYLSPEQSGRTGSTSDQRSDLYAVGATLYEMFCGQPPFMETDALRLIHSHLAQVPTPPHAHEPLLPIALSRIVMRLLEKDPERRYQSADGLACDLQRLADMPNCSSSVDFVLGDHDFGLRIKAPSRLVGRSNELARIFKAFQKAMSGESSVLMISGVPGVGKSALVNELRAVVEARDGYYISARFDQFRQDVKTDAALSVFISLGRQLLAEPEAELNELRLQLKNALGPNIDLMAGINTEFATLLQVENTQTCLVDPLVDGRRLVQGCLDMLRALCAAGRPVVIHLDELQWATPVPLSIVDRLVSEESIPGFLFVGGFSQHGVDPGHPLSNLRSRWNREHTAPPHIHLKNLQGNDLTLFLAAMLKLPTDSATELAEVLAPYTSGNPFATIEFVNVLFTQKLLVHENGWHWDIAAVRDAARNSEVLGLVESSLKRLPSSTLRLLRLMAFLGGQVERELLLLASAESEAGLDSRLRPALDAGLVLPEGEHGNLIRFRHAKVQQVSLRQGRMVAQNRLQLVLARRLASSERYASLAFEHYLAAISLIRSNPERVRVARLFHRAAADLRLINPVLVARLLAGGIDLLDGSNKQSVMTDDLKLMLLNEQHTALYGLGRQGEADTTYQRIVESSVDLVRIVDVSCVQIASLTNRGRLTEAVKLGLALLQELGVVIPDHKAMGTMVCRGLQDFGEWIDSPQRQVDFKRTEIADPTLIAISRIISRLMTPTFFSAPELMAWLCIESRRIWCEHGPCGALVGPIAYCVPALVRFDELYMTGYRVIKHVIKVAEAREFDSDIAHARYLFALTAGHWFGSLTSNADLARRTHDELVQRGDHQSACFCHFALLNSSIICAPSLDGYTDDIALALAFAQRIRNDFASEVFNQYGYWAKVLRAGQPLLAGSVMDDHVQAEVSRLEGNSIAIISSYLLHAHLALIFDMPEQLARYTAFAMRLLPGIPSSHSSMLCNLLRACSLARSGAAQAEADDPRFKEFANCRRWISDRATEAADNFEHLLHLVDAEAAWQAGNYQGAALAFDKARQMASLQPRAWLQAHIAERSAQFQHAHGLTACSRDLIGEAYGIYRSWGAMQKVAQLESSYAWLSDANLACVPEKPAVMLDDSTLSRSTSNLKNSVDAIDLLGVLKASQALSSETSLGPLKSRITEVLEALSGATSVSIILWQEDEQMWRLLPQGESDSCSSLSIEEAGEHNLLPLSAFRYFERMRETLLVDDATCDERFSRDPYVSELQHCSLMMMPLFSNGIVRAVLMLENRLSSHAFVADRLEAVNLVAGQLTVSLDNALLYASLERKVAERTEALAEANERLESLSVTDSLTGIANRRRFDQVLETECLRAQGRGSSIGLALIDIDEFKRFNDNYGHLFGDDALREVAIVLNRSARTDEDLVARYGGEEFVVVLPDTDIRGIRIVAERMRAAVEKLQVEHDYSSHGFLSISVGITAFVPTADMDIEAQIAIVDKALYEAKSQGRNCVVASDDDSDNQPARCVAG